MKTDVPAIILSHGSGGLGAVRTLARRGVDVTVFAYERRDFALISRYPKRSELLVGYTDQDKESDLLSKLRSIDMEGAVLLTTSDRLVTFLSNHREELLKKFRFNLPRTEILNALNDKRQETALIESFGVSVPKTCHHLPNDPDTLALNLRFPIIFKPTSFAVRDIFPDKNAIVYNETQLRDFFSNWVHALDVLIAQEVIPGPDEYSWVCSCTFDVEQRLLDCGIKQKIRMSPPHFGVSTLAISRNNPELIPIIEKLGKKLNSVGHTHLEFRWDDRDSEYKYIEINPRLPGNVGYDDDCGVPTAWNSYNVAIHGEIDTPKKIQNENVYYIEWANDLYSQIKERDPVYLILARFATNFFRKTSSPNFAWDDPFPGIVGLFRFCKSAIGSVSRKLMKPSLKSSKRKIICQTSHSLEHDSEVSTNQKYARTKL